MNAYESALDLIRNGWGKGSSAGLGLEGNFCLLGAMAKVKHGNASESYVYRDCPETTYLASLIREQYPKFALQNDLADDVSLCWLFNDLMGFEAVEQILEKAAANH